MHRARMFNRAPNMFTADGARDVDEGDHLSSVEHEPPEPSPRLSYSTSAAAPTRDVAFLALAPPPPRPSMMTAALPRSSPESSTTSRPALQQDQLSRHDAASHAPAAIMAEQADQIVHDLRPQPTGRPPDSPPVPAPKN